MTIKHVFMWEIVNVFVLDPVVGYRKTKGFIWLIGGQSHEA